MRYVSIVTKMTSIALQRWTDEDLPLLHLTLGDPVMMEHLGGIETPEQIVARHARYLHDALGGAMFTIRAFDDVVGSIGFWEREWEGQPVYETGWMVLSQYAGRGIASEAARKIVKMARADGRHRFLHAYPSADNPASNKVCEKAGFTNLGECAFEYPKGHLMRCNDWRYDLRHDRGTLASADPPYAP